MKHPYLLLMVVGLYLQLAMPQARGADLPPIKEAVFFGDSLTDAGSFGFRFTTASGTTWAQRVAEHYGQSTEPNEHLDSYADAYRGIHPIPGPGGLNYAEGGARAGRAYSAISEDPEGAPISAQVQLRHFLSQHGTFRRDQIVMLYIGTNDVAYDYDPTINPALAAELRAGKRPTQAVLRAQRTRVEAAADATVQVATDILHSGAQRLVVFQLADLGEDPWFRTPASRALVNELTRVFNRRVAAGLPHDPRILVIRMQDFLTPILAHPERHGFRHGAHEDACREPDQDFCDANSLASPDAAESYVFAAGEHLTTHTHELLAGYVLDRIARHAWQ